MEYCPVRVTPHTHLSRPVAWASRMACDLTGGGLRCVRGVSLDQGGNFYRLCQGQPNKRLTEAASRFYCAEILSGIEYLHLVRQHTHVASCILGPLAERDSNLTRARSVGSCSTALCIGI